MTDIDTGVASIPAARPSVFTPAALVVGQLLDRPPVATDSGQATAAAPLANTFDPAPTTVIADPGDVGDL